MEKIENEECYVWFNKGVAQGIKHAEPSPETRRFMEEVGKKLDQVATKELFDSRFEDLKELFNYKFEENKIDHDKVWEQVKTTNGSVKELKLWKWMLAGAWAVVCIGFPALFYYYTLNNDKGIDLKILSAIKKHEEETKTTAKEK